MLKRIMFFLIIVSFWFFPYTFTSLNKGFFWLNQDNFTLFLILYFIITILIPISIYKIITKYEINNNYKFLISLNYLINPVFVLLIFDFNSLFFSLISLLVLIFVNTILFFETKKIDRFASLLIIPNIVCHFYLIVTIIYLLNIF